MSNYCFKKKSHEAIEFITGNFPAGDFKLLVYRPGNSSLYQPKTCEVKSIEKKAGVHEIVFLEKHQNITAILNLTEQPDQLVGRIVLKGTGCLIARLLWELPPQETAFNFVPAFMYGDNKGGNCASATYPRLDGCPGNFTTPWEANEWEIRTDRSSHGFTSLLCTDRGFAIGGRDVCFFSNDNAVAEKTGLSTSKKKSPQLSFSLGFINRPYTYSLITGRNCISRCEGYLNLDKGDVESEIFILTPAITCRQDGLNKLLRSSYEILHTPQEINQQIKPAINDIAEALIEYGYCFQARNFYTTFHEDNTGLVGDDFSSAWAGGAQVALPLLLAGYRLEKRDWIEISQNVLDNLAENALSEKSCLFYENYNLTKNQWNVHGWWYGCFDKAGHSAYVNGQLCYYLLQGYLLEKENGHTRSRWVNSVQTVLDHVLSCRSAESRFGYTYNPEDGTILDEVGFCGVWFIPALACLYEITGSDKYLQGAVEAMNAYRTDVENFEVFGTPHDTFKSPDQEGILGWVQAAKILHQLTGGQRYVDDLLLGLNYEFSWKFAYDVTNEVEPLKSLNWASTGGSVTSVNNSHIHPMGSAILPAIRYAAEITRDPYLQSRLDDTLNWTLKAYQHYDGEYGWGRKGMINERFCYTDSLLIERFADGSPASTWFCGHSWASGSVLEGLAGLISD